MITKATIEQLPLLHACAEEFYAASKHLHLFDLDKFVGLWTDAIESGYGVVFIAEDNGQILGTIAGMAHQDIYSSEMVASEFFWFVKESSRGGGIALYRAFESWAREQGCKSIQMVHLLDSMPEKVGHFYKRMGFEAVEVRYSKSLEAVTAQEVA